MDELVFVYNTYIYIRIVVVNIITMYFEVKIINNDVMKIDLKNNNYIVWVEFILSFYEIVYKYLYI